jgi:hypothetical protein
MTDEAYWPVATDPDWMLATLGEAPSRRQLVLFACACCRRVWPLLTDERSRRVVEAAEGWADGLTAAALVHQALRALRALRATRGTPGTEDTDGTQGTQGAAPGPGRWARLAAGRAFAGDRRAAAHAAWCARMAVPGTGEGARQCGLLRDLFGHPFRVVDADPAWLRWDGGAVVGLARAAYRDRVPPAGNLAPERLLVLADALEDAGSSDPDILGHLRGPGPHVPGCWVLDRLREVPR